MIHQRRDRRLAWLLLAVAAALLGARLWLLQGLTTRVEVDGGSMAEALPGQHVEFRCRECSRGWRVDAAQVAGSYLACPECGQAVDEQTPRIGHAALRVLIDRAAYLLDRPQRFDVAAFQALDSGDIAVKRIIALPGEAWRIEGGEIYIDNEILRKSYAQFRETATLVSATPQRWKPEDSSRWQVSDDAWSCQSPGETIQRLSYNHVAAHPATRGQASPVQDLDPYNPSIARELNDVRDVVGRCQLSARDLVLNLRIHDISVRWDLAAGEVVARCGEREVARVTTLAGPLDRTDVAWGHCDGRLWLVVKDQVLLQHEVECSESSATPLAIGVSGTGECELRRLRVLRDIYYLDPHQRGGAWQPEPLGEDEYALLGDNPPLSIDNRIWDQGIPRKNLLGKVWPLGNNHARD